jgi:hypothetical protein
MKRMLRGVLGFALLVSLIGAAACVSVGKKFPVEQVPNIEIGVHSKADIQRLFGPPWRTGLEDGETTWTYADYKRALAGEKHTRDLIVRFNGDGIVSSYSFSSDKPEDTSLQKKPAAEF